MSSKILAIKNIVYWHANGYTYPGTDMITIKAI
jgi:hypothetical protein